MAYERWSLTEGTKCSDLIGKLLSFKISVAEDRWWLTRGVLKNYSLKLILLSQSIDYGDSLPGHRWSPLISTLRDCSLIIRRGGLGEN